MACAACAPALNWRSVALGDTQAWLPCKADRAERDVQLAGQTVRLEIVGCEAEGALFAASRLQVPAGADKNAIQADWYRASMTSLGDGARAQAAPSLAADGQGRGPDGRALQARFLWQVGTQDIVLLAVYAPAIRPDMTEPFLVDLKLK